MEEKDLAPSASALLTMNTVTEWFDARKAYFNLDKFYGIDMLVELYMLVRSVQEREPEPSLQEKYDFLCDKLAITAVDHWEQDALLSTEDKIYFQFSEAPETVDEAVLLAIKTTKFQSSLEKML